MALLSQGEVLGILVGFLVAMVVILTIGRRFVVNTRLGFYVAERRVGVVPGALSVAVSWVWAPALFVASSISFDLGLPGALWFIVPNVLCFFVFAPLAIRFRKKVPEGFTLPGYFRARFPNDHRVAQAFSVTTILFALAAIVENLVAIKKLYTFYTGGPGWVAIVAVSVVTLGYSVFSGMRASVLTDVFQMSLLILVGFILVPWTLNAVPGGVELSVAAFSGSEGDMAWLAVAFAPGLSLLFGLIGGPLGDQMFFQRAMAVDAKRIRQTMYLAGSFFAVVPIVLSAFGFIGSALRDRVEVGDSELVGAVLVAEFLPMSASILFLIMMICGLASTLDSAYCATGAVGGRDILARISPAIEEKAEIAGSRWIMLLTAIVGAALAAVSRDIWFVFMTDASIAAAGIVPIVLAVYWDRLRAGAAFWALTVSVGIGCAISIAGHFFGASQLAAMGAPIAVVVGLAVAILGSLRSN